MTERTESAGAAVREHRRAAPPLLVHDWIERDGGAERVLDRFLHNFPDSEMVCLWDDAPERYPGTPVHQSLLSRTPLRRHKAAAMPLLPLQWRHTAGSRHDWAIVSTHLFAHHIRLAPGATKMLYVHTPARYFWDPQLDDRGKSLPVRIAAPAFRAIDRLRAKEATSIAANSEFVRERIGRAWDRDAAVIYPPVDVNRIVSVARWRDRLSTEDQAVVESLPPLFVLGASRLVAYKRLDQVLAVGAEADVPVVVVGSGPDLPRLKAIAAGMRQPVVFLGRVSDALLYALFQLCIAFVFPPVEDFGIIPVEAMAAGAVVVGNRRGGVSESIVDGLTGALTDFRSPSDIADALARAALCSPEAARVRAAAFSAETFDDGLAAWVQSTLYGRTSAA